MKLLSQKLTEFAGEPAHWCEGCEELHRFAVHKPLHPEVPEGQRNPQWTWDGNVESPTFQPSMLIRSSWEGQATVCHYFLHNGKLQYLNDCTHHLKGQTVELPTLPDWVLSRE